MSELIDRLDALLANHDEHELSYDHHQWRQYIYPELRAEVLRLEEERDQESKSRVQRGVTITELRAERDALVEALKKARGKLIDAGMYSRDDARRMVNDAESIMWAALDKLEPNHD